MSAAMVSARSQAPMPVAARGRTAGVRVQAAAARALPQGLTANPLRKSMAMGRTVRRASVPTSRRSAVVVEAKKVALLGAAGGIGQPLALLLKMNPQISELRLYDIMNVKGVAADLSHVNTPAQVTGHTGAEELGSALSGVDLVIIPAGVPRKPGMTRDDLFNINAGIVRTLVQGVADHAPEAILNIISNPVNSTVPIAAETLKKAGVFDPRKVLGVTTLDIVRAETFYAEKAGLDVLDVSVPVVGGHAGETILPLFSQATPFKELPMDVLAPLTERTQNAGTEVVEAKAGAGSATLSMAYAAARFAESVLLALSGEPDVVECAYVRSDVQPGFEYFSSKVLLGTEGVKEVLSLGQLSAFEQEGLEKMKTLLAKNIETGVAFANKA